MIFYADDLKMCTFQLFSPLKGAACFMIYSIFNRFVATGEGSRIFFEIIEKKLLFSLKLPIMYLPYEQEGVAIMKINESDLQPQLSVYKNVQTQGGELASAKSKTSAAPISLQDRVALSGRGQLIADAQRSMASIPDVRETLVAKIQTEVQNGTYAVDNEKVAEGILREAMTNQAAMA